MQIGLNLGRIFFFLVIQTSFIIQFGIFEYEKNTIKRTFKLTLSHSQGQGIPGKMSTGYICLETKEEWTLSPRHGTRGFFVFVSCFVFMCCQKSRNLMHKQKKVIKEGSFILIFQKEVSKILQHGSTVNLVSKVIIFPACKIQFCLIHSFIHSSIHSSIPQMCMDSLP